MDDEPRDAYKNNEDSPEEDLVRFSLASDVRISAPVKNEEEEARNTLDPFLVATENLSRSSQGKLSLP